MAANRAGLAIRTAAGRTNGHDRRRYPPTAGYRRATSGAGCRRAAAGDPRLPRRDRARAAPAESPGRATARRRLLPHGDPALAGRPAGRSADLHCASSNCWPRAPARSAGTSPTTASANSSRSACRTRACTRSHGRARHRHRRHRRAGRRAGGAGRRRLSRHRPLDLRQRLPGELLDAGQLPDPR